MRLKILVIVGIISVILTACSSMLVQDVKPPASFVPTWQVPQEDINSVEIAPLLKPNSVEGNSVYKAECEACHGSTGLGDGPKTGNLPSIPPPVGSLDHSRRFSPAAWFQVVTTGRIDRMMPGYGNTLSDRQRWDVVAHLLLLGEKSGQAEDGSVAYEETCKRCHGQGGNTGPAPDLTRPQMLQRSLDDVIGIMVNGYGSMPAAGMEMPADSQLNTAIYLRSLQFAQPDVELEPTVNPIPSVSENSAQETTISGRIVNGSGKENPVGLPVDLLVYDSKKMKYSERQKTSDGGSFMFKNVAGGSGEVYLLTTTYRDIVYSSNALHSSRETDLTNQIITVYETDTDIAPVVADRMHIFFEFPAVDTIRVIQMYILSNPTNMLIVSPDVGEPVIRYSLPAGASNLQFEGGNLGDRFVLTPDGFGDTQGIAPGIETQVLFSFDMAYKPDLPFYIKIPVPVEMANVMLPAGSVTIKSGRLQLLGEKDIQGAKWVVYLSDRLEKGTPLDLLVSGKPVLPDLIADDWNTNLAVGVITMVVTITLAGMVIYQKILNRRKLALVTDTPKMSAAERDAILDTIIALDDQYHAGQIPHAAYMERRNELKCQMRGDCQ